MSTRYQEKNQKHEVFNDYPSYQHTDCNVCSICFEHLHQDGGQGETKTVHTPCAHSFHSVCLKAWEDYQATCPLCRSELPAKPPVVEVIEIDELPEEMMVMFDLSMEEEVPFGYVTPPLRSQPSSPPPVWRVIRETPPPRPLPRFRRRSGISLQDILYRRIDRV